MSELVERLRSRTIMVNRSDVSKAMFEAADKIEELEGISDALDFSWETAKQRWHDAEEKLTRIQEIIAMHDCNRIDEQDAYEMICELMEDKQ